MAAQTLDFEDDPEVLCLLITEQVIHQVKGATITFQILSQDNLVIKYQLQNVFTTTELI